MDTAGKRRVLLVLFEGLATTVIDSAVLDHARQMSRAGLEFEIWALCWTAASYRQAGDRLEEAQRFSGSKIVLRRAFRPGAPFSVLLNTLLLLWMLIRLRPGAQVIHARTDYSAVVCRAAKWLSSVSLVWDCRGDTAAEAAERIAALGAPPRVARLKAWLAHRLRTAAARHCDRAIFVSEPLFRLCAPALGTKPYAVVPCAAPEDLFFYDPDLRERTRNRLGFLPDDLVLVYSGAFGSWYQCLAETIALFRESRRRNGQVRLLILTPEVAEISAEFEEAELERITILRVGFQDVNAYLNAGDVALMLRRDSAVNLVASPTKFAEYCLAGLPIVMTDAVAEAARIARSLGNMVPPQGGELRCALPSERARVAQQARGLVGKSAFTGVYSWIYGDPASVEPRRTHVPVSASPPADRP